MLPLLRIPSDVGVESGGQQRAVVVNKDDCEVYELAGVSAGGGGFTVTYGAVFDLTAMEAATQRAGGTERAVTKSGLPLFPGLLRYDDAEAATGLQHALAFTLNADPAAHVSGFAPAMGASNAADQPPYGLRFRIKASYTTPAAITHPVALKVVNALRTYGMIFVDSDPACSGVCLLGEGDARWATPLAQVLANIDPAAAFEAVLPHSAMSIVTGGSFPALDCMGVMTTVDAPSSADKTALSTTCTNSPNPSAFCPCVDADCPSVDCSSTISGRSRGDCSRFDGEADGVCISSTACATSADTATVCAGVATVVAASCASSGCRHDSQCLLGQSTANIGAFCTTDGSQASCPSGLTCTSAGLCAEPGACDETPPPCMGGPGCTAECGSPSGCPPAMGVCPEVPNCTAAVRGWNGDNCERFSASVASPGVCAFNGPCATATEYEYCPLSIPGTPIAGKTCADTNCRVGCVTGTPVSSLGDVCLTNGEQGSCPCGQQCGAMGACVPGNIADPGCEGPGPRYTATCDLVGTSADPGITGVVTFTATSEGGDVTVTVNAEGITVNPNESHAVHVHSFGDLTFHQSGVATGGHYTGASGGDGQSHGCPPSGSRHTGDLGAFRAQGGRIADAKRRPSVLGATNPPLRLDGPNSIIGRAVVLHAGDDSCGGDSGDAGARLATCVIGVGAVLDDQQQRATGEDAPVPTGGVCALRGASVACGSAVAGKDCAIPGDVGVAYFDDVPGGGVRVRVAADGLAPAEDARGYALHLHEHGDVSVAPGGGSGVTGGNVLVGIGKHFDPEETGSHGLPIDMSPHHAGDFGGFGARQGTATVYDVTHGEGTTLSVAQMLGRTLVVREGADRGAGSSCDNDDLSADGVFGRVVLACVVGQRSGIGGTPEGIGEGLMAPFPPLLPPAALSHTATATTIRSIAL